MTAAESGSVVRTYDRYAPIYDKLFGAVLEPGRRALAARATACLQGEAPRLLEVGVGTGLTLHLYSPRYAITGVDVSDLMLAKARERAASLPQHRIDLVRMDAEGLAFPDHAFDVVTLPYVLSVTPHPRKLVDEVRRVCRPGGTILVLNHFSGSRFWWMFERLVRPLADRVGFRSDFAFDDHVGCHDWVIQQVDDVNLLGLSKLVTIRNA